MNYSSFGWLSFLILAIIMAPYILNLLNRKIFKTKNKTYFKIVKAFRSVHKPLGIALIFFGIIHGFMALRRISFHTGYIVYLSILITGILGGAFYRLKKKELFTWHKRMALVTVLLFLLHFFFPNAIYYLLG